MAEPGSGVHPPAMPTPQPGILAPVPRVARYLRLQRGAGVGPSAASAALARLARASGGEDRVVGLGASLVAALGGAVPPLRPFPALAGPGPSVPSTPADLWVWLRGDDRGDLVHATRAVEAAAGDAFEVEEVVDAFQHRDSRDLTGFVDGTENPAGDDAAAAAVASGLGPGLDGSSFVAVQRWEHDLDAFEELSERARDRVIGRRLRDDVELDDAPEDAHVKRTEQEETGFVVRRSMPWSDPDGEGLVFVAFGRDFDAFEAQLRRMVGLPDGLVDRLFTISRPVDGAYYWCPPRGDDGGLDLRALGL